MSGFQELLRRKIDFVPIQILEEQAKNVSKGIKQFSKKYHADLIVLLKEDKNFLQSIFGHSTTKAMLKDIDIPILIYQE
jgi:nucleotide-binding universal stress UspA family protein